MTNSYMKSEKSDDSAVALPGLTLENVRVVYEKNEVVRGLNLVVNEGEFVVLLGASGSGKTTTLKAVAGFVPIDSGKIVALDRRLDILPVEHRNVGVVFQDYALFPHMTVRKNIEFGLRIRRTSSGERKRRVDEMIDLVGLGKLADSKPSILSGGQKQRVALARALVYTPSVLLMDEPLAALDRKLRGGLQDEIRRIVREAGTTTLYVTHDQEEAFNLADRVAILQHGSLTQVASPSELYDNPSSLYTAWFVGDANAIRIHVESIDGGTVTGKWVGKHGSVMCHLSAKRGEGVLNSGVEAVGIIRPESVIVHHLDETDQSQLRRAGTTNISENEGFLGMTTAGTLVDVRVVGSEIRYELDVAGERLTSRKLRMVGASHGQPGDRVEIVIQQSAILALPDDRGEFGARV